MRDIFGARLPDKSIIVEPTTLVASNNFPGYRRIVLLFS